MRTLILAAGRFGDEMRSAIAAGREPRLDVFELAKALDADVVSYLDVDRSTSTAVRSVNRAFGPSAALALVGYLARERYDALFTSGEDIGLPLGSLLRTSRAQCSHTMIAHTLAPKKKRVFFDYLGVESRIDRILAYSTNEEQNAIQRLRVPARKIQRIYFHADEAFFRPDGRPVEPDLICAAGQLLRDYECLVEAARDLPVRIQIAAGSPWISHDLRPRTKLPDSVTWGKLNRFELRELYARSALCVVPIFENEYQTGIATILEMMSMGKCVIASRTKGQTDTIVDGVTGVYVPPGNPRALRAAIEKLMANPAEAAKMGQAARRFVEEQAGLGRFVDRIVQAVRAGHADRFGS
jgi:glycosyltransferase involved in cell wall biosynthesis